MTLTREELHQLDLLLDKICFGAKDCASCPMGITPLGGGTQYAWKTGSLTGSKHESN